MNFKVWRKSTRSQGHNDCVEVSSAAGVVGIRDSKHPTGRHLTIPTTDWTTTVTQFATRSR